ncbi:hypothetical protein BASA83_013302 [Batrachochytrium salamandrivorans]|nr:hypothetical protein BASA83_013302 [Batrachochytrium salamandrivorans]
MISLYGLFILLLTAEAIYAQGDTDDDGDYFDHASDYNPKSKKAGRLLQKSRSMDRHRLLRESGISDKSGASSSTGSKSKKAGRLLQRLRSMNKHGPLRENDIPDESDASSSADTKPKKVSQPSTSHDSFQSNEVLLPNYVEKSKVESYYQSQNPEQYNAFVEEETKYFGSEYLIEKKKLGRPKDQPAAQCMSPRPSKLYVPHEVRFQMYLSRPGHENPYVLRVLDYFILKDKFMLIMDYLGKSWMSLLSLY